MAELAGTYADLKNVDKIAVISANVEEVRGNMETNVKKMLDNQANLKTTEQKSATMSKAAQTFA
jgi:hypothetical protein